MAQRAAFGRPQIIDIRDFGVDLTGGSDDTASVQLAVTQIAALGIPAAGRTRLSIPAGRLNISTPITGIGDGLEIEGAGERLTRISYTGTGTLFSLRAFSTSPAPDYRASNGDWQLGFSMSRVQLSAPLPSGFFGNEGSRTPTAIQDNGQGESAFTGSASGDSSTGSQPPTAQILRT
jgi:hypothetical protein